MIPHLTSLNTSELEQYLEDVVLRELKSLNSNSNGQGKHRCMTLSGSKAWAKCGGRNWDGATCCEEGYKCIEAT